MIKIRINNINQKKQEYIDEVTNLVAERVLVLQQSLSHLNGAAINFGAVNLLSLRTITKAIVNSIGDPIAIANGENGYTDAVTNYLAGVNQLGNININGLRLFCDDLLANNNQEISNLLVCDVVNLLALHTGLLNHYGINTPANIAIVKLAFDYAKYALIAATIKAYFRRNNFVKFCPYCNVESASHQTNQHNVVVKSFELDHFYDKARYPLLSYSLFNLVPSDHTCNVTNKLQIQFNDNFYLNPHSSGYNDRIAFRPIGLTTSYDVSRIEVQILEAAGSPLYNKINGNNHPMDEDGELGNLNVFKIRSKYKDETHLAGKILKILLKEDKQLRHINKYIKALGAFDKKASYVEWYENELNVPFKPENFNDKAYSKFSRDIHDYYYSKNKSFLNNYIRELIDAH